MIPKPDLPFQAQPQLVFRAKRFSLAQELKCPTCGLALVAVLDVDGETKRITVTAHGDPLCSPKSVYESPEFIAKLDEMFARLFARGGST